MRRLNLFAIAGAALLALGLVGCGYAVRPLGYSFRPPAYDIETVYVPIFTSKSFRREINMRMTEAVIKKIEQRTPYKVVGTPEGADTILKGSVFLADKGVMVESPFNFPRQLMGSIACVVSWEDMRQVEKPTPVVPAMTFEMGQWYPEIGETADLGFQKTIDRLAEDIVDMMERPWPSEPEPQP